MVPNTLYFNRIMLLRLETSVHIADMVSTGDIELYTVDVYFFPAFIQSSCAPRVSDVEGEHDRRVQSVCESTFDKV